jgi:hypothetical protein
MTGDQPITLRCGEPRDEAALARLAALDSARPPARPVLLAERDGVLLAAISLADGFVVADPFKPTAALVELLRMRERQLRAPARPRRRRWLPARARRRVPATG